MRLGETTKKILKCLGVLLALLILVMVVAMSREKDWDSYAGEYAPDGSFCDYGYNTRTKQCCDDDDYSCEVQDKAPKGATEVCIDGTYSRSMNVSRACIGHGGVQTDSQFTPYAQ